MNDPYPPKPPRAWGPGSQAPPQPPPPPPPPPPTEPPPSPTAPQAWTQPPPPPPPPPSTGPPPSPTAPQAWSQPPPPAAAPGWGPPQAGGPPPPGTQFPPPGQGQPPPAWGGPPPPPKKSRAGLIIGLVAGGVVLLLLLLVGLIALGSSREDKLTTVGPDLSTSTTGEGATTSVAGTGPRVALTGTQAASLLRDKQEQATPDLTIGSASCPPSPYRVGQVIVCRIKLEDTTVLYQVEITGDRTVNLMPTKPIIDTDKAEPVVESNEPGTTAECGSPRVRQVEIGSTFTCRTASSTWEFTVLDERGKITGSRR